MSHTEEEIRTPLTFLFHYLKERAVETNLLHILDVEALNKLAALNQLQQQADKLSACGDPKQKEIRRQFSILYNWLHESGDYPIHKDAKTGLWRLGIYLLRRDRES